MIAAINTVFEHDGTEYHLHCEDLGLETRSVEIRILDHGGILWEKRMPYAVEDGTESRAAIEQAVRSQMAKAVKTVQAAIVAGRLP